MLAASLNEIEAVARKAARGAGMSWGLAEEAGKAARWLALHDQPGLAALVDLLEWRDGRAHETLRPHETTGADGARLWQAAGGALCPVAAGTALVDFAFDLRRADASIRLHIVRTPLLLLPFIARAAAEEGRRFEMTCGAPGGDPAITQLSPDGPTGPLPRLPGEADILIRPATDGGTRSERATPRIARGVAVDRRVWARAERLAHRTYVPASDGSRLSGAGAGLSDND
ncbi:DUF3726 domain-containing protein [Marivibrio halodurans]|uniref:DUF3726 domain-containing protein n=1 Tax=Marivibrio halodurans TaxID=2039722 RepID=A0A8J7V1Y9_9PROT|nr:DUF3726 domain-containing protein [Marivibrio halodurans]MBP5856601.1 DUF3726 domain-containing protein [Marivibrio halodurans]